MLSLIQLEVFCCFSHGDELVCGVLFSGALWIGLFGFFNIPLRDASSGS